MDRLKDISEKMNSIPRAVLRAFELDPQTISPIPVGLVHQTFKAETDRGIFILQRQHPVFGSDTVRIVDAVSNKLKEVGILSPQIEKTKGGKLYVEHDGSIWRLMNYIPGKVVTEVETPESAYEAGFMLGNFHRAMENFIPPVTNPYRSHNTGTVFEKFVRVTSETLEKQFIEPRDVVLKNLPLLFFPSTTRMVTIHGDPKISNFIFDEANAVRAKAIIDLDTCQRHSVLADLGDAFRSWCGGREDDPKNSFGLQLFEAGLRGYTDGSREFLLPEEKSMLPKAVQCISLELAARFLNDYVEDFYFGWDNTRYASRKEHNLARAKGQIALFGDIAGKENELQKIINC